MKKEDIDKSTKAIRKGFEIEDAITKRLEDGHMSWGEAASLALGNGLDLVYIIQHFPEILAELKDLDNEEAAKLYAQIADELGIPTGNVRDGFYFAAQSATSAKLSIQAFRGNGS